MSRFKKIFFTLMGILVVLVIVVVLSSGAIFRKVLRSALADVRQSHDIEIRFADGDLSLSGSASLDDIEAVDLESKTKFADIKRLETKVGIASLFSNPIIIEKIGIDEPELTLFPGIRYLLDRGSGAETKTKINGEESTPSRGGRDVLVKRGEVRNGHIRYKADDSESVLVAQVDGSVDDLSNSTPFSFDVESELSGESKGSIKFKGTIDPESTDSEVNLEILGLEMPFGESRWPLTNGAANVVLKNSLSEILSTGRLKMASPPPGLPPKLHTDQPFEINWKVDASLDPKGTGKMELDTLDLGVMGLVGGAQRLTGKGSYDPKTAVGNFVLAGNDFSAPLLNPFLEPSIGLRILSGKANINAELDRSGPDSAFELKAKVSLSGLTLKDTSGQRSDLQFAEIDLNLAASYTEKYDAVAIHDLSIRLDDINLQVTGSILSAQDEHAREVDLVVKNDNLDLGRVVPLAMPEFSETGKISGVAGINLSVKGKTKSEKFPILNGNIDLKSVKFTPADQPEMVIGAKGPVEFNMDTIRGTDLDLNLGGVPGRATFIVQGYNEPKKRINATLRGIAIEPLVNLYKPSLSGLLIGNFNGDIKTVIGQGSRPEALQVDFTIDDGTLLTRHPIPAAIVGFVQWDWLRNGYRLTKGEGKIVQDAKGYVFDPIILMGAKGGLAFTGRLTFDNKFESTTARLNVDKQAIDEVPRAIQYILRSREGSRYAHFDLPIAGSASLPLPDFGKLGVDAGVGLIKDKVKEQIDERAGEYLEGILGDNVPDIFGGEGEEEGGIIEDAGSLLKGLFKTDE